MWLNVGTIGRSAVSKARKKVPWQTFEDLFYRATKLAYELFPQDPKYLWHGMSVFAFDGSKYDLPATQSIRDEFDPESGLGGNSKGHYPQCLVSTAYDVFRRLPVARTVVGMKEANERHEAKNLIAHIPVGNMLCFDRGYPSYELLLWLTENYDGHYLFRSVASNTFSAVNDFVKSDKEEAVIWIDPSNSFLTKKPIEIRKTFNPIKIRAIRLISPDGVVSVLLTSLFDMDDVTKEEIIELYFKRWEVETYYRDEKVFLGIEKFHSKLSNGIRQELFGVLVMSVITRILMVISKESAPLHSKDEPQFKNSIMALSSDMALFTSHDPVKALEVFQEILSEIRRVKYYRPKKPRPSQPRVSKRPPNKWIKKRATKLTAA